MEHNYVRLEQGVRQVDVLQLEIVSNKNKIPREVCNLVIQQLHQSLRDNLNWNVIWPELNKKKLLAAHPQIVFIDPSKTDQDKCDHLIAILSSCTQEDYLTPFVECLIETRNSGVGTLHEELLQRIDELWTKEMTKFTGKVEPHHHSGYKITLCHRQFSIQKLIAVLLIVAVSFAVVTSLSIIITKRHYRAAKRVVGHGIVPLNDIIHNNFSSSVNMQWNNTNVCTGQVISLIDQDCFQSDDGDLTKLDSINLEEIPDYLPFYMLQHSSLSIFIPSNVSLEITFLYIIKSIDKYETVVSQSCCLTIDNCKSEELCYRVNNHRGSWINKTINDSDFYNILLINDDSKECETPENICIFPRLDYDITYQLNIISFNDTYISKLTDRASLPPVHVESDHVPLLTIYRWFDYHSTCYLLKYTCDRNAIPASNLLVVNGRDPRWDIITLIGVLYVFAMCIFCVIFSWSSIIKTSHKITCKK